MYYNYYGMFRNPFDGAVDPQQICMTKTHREAFAMLIHGIHEKKPFIAVLGDVGTGKTTLLQAAIVAAADQKARIVQIFQPLVSPAELNKIIAEKLIALSEEQIISDPLEGLDWLIVREAEISGRVIIIIDEAQRLPQETLEHLRLLSNLSASQSGLLQIVFAAQPNFWEALQRPQLRALQQRISVRAVIKPMSDADARDYVEYKLHLAGSSLAAVMDEKALKALLRRAHGIPRRINIIMDNALVAGFGLSLKPITPQIIEQGAASIDTRILAKIRDAIQPQHRVALLSGIAAGALLTVVVVAVSTSGEPHATSSAPPSPQLAAAPAIIPEKPAPVSSRQEITRGPPPKAAPKPAGLTPEQLAILQSPEPVPPTSLAPLPAPRAPIVVSRASAVVATPARPMTATAAARPQTPANEGHGVPLIRLPGVTQIEYRTGRKEKASDLMKQYYGRADQTAINLFAMLNPLIEDPDNLPRGTWLHLPVNADDHASNSGPNQSGPNQSGPNQSGPNQSGPNQSGPNQSGPNQSLPGRPTPARVTNAPVAPSGSASNPAEATDSVQSDPS